MGIFDFFSKNKNKKVVEPELRLGFVLFDSQEIDWSAFIRNLAEDWDLEVAEAPPEDGPFSFEVDEMLVAAVFTGVPVPDGEAADNAKNNYLWPEAEAVARQHQGHVILSVMRGKSAVRQAALFTKVAASFLKLDNATAIYQSPTVLSKEQYIETANALREDELPLLNWIYIGVYPADGGCSGYTYGLDYFGKEDMEVIGTKETPETLFGLLYDVAAYVIDGDVTLRPGETVGFTAGQKLKVSRSPGVAMEKETLKIEY